MSLKRLNILTHCGWGSDFAIVGCYKPKGHTDPHTSAAGLPEGLTRAEQEDYKARMKGRIIGHSPAPKG